MDNNEDNIIIICHQKQKIIKIELEGAYNPNLECNAKVVYYTFDKEDEIENAKD